MNIYNIYKANSKKRLISKIVSYTKYSAETDFNKITNVWYKDVNIL